MKTAPLLCSFVCFILLFSEINSAYGVKELESGSWHSQLPVLEARDEEAQYPDYESNEQDRWPTMEEISRYSRQRRIPGKNRLSHELKAEDHLRQREIVERESGKGQSISRTHQASMPTYDREVLKRHLENALYDLLSSTARLPTKTSNTEGLRSLAKSVNGNRAPRSVDIASSSMGSSHGMDSQMTQHIAQESEGGIGQGFV